MKGICMKEKTTFDKMKTTFDKMLELDNAIELAKAQWWDRYFLSWWDSSAVADEERVEQAKSNQPK